ncbi:hypothetical protein [Streptomyces sp. H27-C3]|uniref:hypothetical protein n=1 Tax=Streptomyces sp. H27-C3 TaxID=3046305 RepID=UPI0024B9EDE4|nr:hypothetical protein [Streptomyces sp. H27-C3]MDJ0463078.1 hypothetical protein [Streptomyces sp. H27-C3]
MATMYTLVQHSGGTGFERAVEEVSVSTIREQDHIQRAGGVLLRTYQAASDAADAENYPPGAEGIIPQARGTFSNKLVNGLPLYIPPTGFDAPVVKDPVMVQGFEVKLCYPVAGRRLILAELDGKFVVATIPAEGLPKEWDLGVYRSDPGGATKQYAARWASLSNLELLRG